MQEQLNRALKEGIRFLKSEQQTNGCFESLSSADKDNFQKAKVFKTSFFTSNILHCLNAIPAEIKEARSIKQKAAEFLLTQKSEQGSFNYWQRGSAESKTMPYPDDLDDTFCALTGLYGFDSKLIGGKTLAKAAKLLTTTESAAGGPYRTWLISKNAAKVWKDVDLAVNANIAYFLSLQGASLPKLTRLLDEAINKKDFSSSYYPDEFATIYFISRSYKGKNTKALADYITKRLKEKKNPLNTAFCITALVNLGCVDARTLKSPTESLLKSFNGRWWQASAFCLDPAKNGKKYYGGAKTLTTAFCLEALSKYLNIIKDSRKKAEQVKTEAKDNKFYKNIIGLAEKRFGALPLNTREQALMALFKIKSKDTDRQIVLLPIWFQRAMGKAVSESQIEALGLANLYGWIAYSIYDDFFDGEGDPAFLPVANTALREVAEIYQRLLQHNQGAFKMTQKILDRIDSANVWEHENCRAEVVNDQLAIPRSLPKFGDFHLLANKSLGHALGPLAIMIFLGFESSSAAVKNMLGFFTHYLIARQLNDDAHDWLEDLEAGRLNSIRLEVLKNSGHRVVNFKRDSYVLQSLFWKKIIPKTSRDIFKQVALAKKCLYKIPLKEPGLLLRMIAKPESAAKQALEESLQTKDFLNTY